MSWETSMQVCRTLLTAAVVMGCIAVGWGPARAEITVTQAEYAAGVLVVAGETQHANQKVGLDGRYFTETDKNNRFRFRIRYMPNDCTISLTAGQEERPAAVKNCASEGRIELPQPTNESGPNTLKPPSR